MVEEGGCREGVGESCRAQQGLRQAATPSGAPAPGLEGVSE